MPVHCSNSQCEARRDGCFADRTREQALADYFPHLFRDACLWRHASNERGSIRLKLTGKFGRFFRQGIDQHLAAKQKRVLPDAELYATAKEALEWLAVLGPRPLEARNVRRNRLMSQLPAPGDPVAEKRTDDLVAIAEGRWIRMVAYHRDMRAPVLEDEFLIAVDHPHISLSAPEHVTEGTARAEQKSPQSSEHQRKRHSDIDPERLATVSKDGAYDGRMFI